MRFVPISCLREGMILGKTLYGFNNEILLTSGITLNSTYINRISILKYNGVYIEDDLSKDIEVANVISDDLRIQTVKGIKNIFIASPSEKNTPKSQMMKNFHNFNNTKIFVENIIDEIINNKNLMINMIDLKVFDEYTFFHSVNVAVLSIVLGVALNLNKEQLYKLGLAALLHDIGKVFIPKEILDKPGKLTQDEFKVMQNHSEVGYKYVKENYDVPITSYVGILHHHEKWDGTGYPEGKKEDNISLFGRIISLCDVYDALTSDRPYRTGLPPSEAMEYIMGGSGRMFDPKLVQVFVRKVAPYPIGTCVILSNNSVGIVIENHEECCLRPSIRIFKQNDDAIEPYIIDLIDNSNSDITILDVLKI